MHVVKATLHIVGNAFALWLADKYIPGFVVNAGFLRLLIIALILALLNFLLKPVLVLILGPVILLTLGLGILVVNALILFLLPILTNHIDFLAGSITIQSVPALILGTLIVTVINTAIHIL